jgi:hypothetical protein
VYKAVCQVPAEIANYYSTVEIDSSNLTHFALIAFIVFVVRSVFFFTCRSFLTADVYIDVYVPHAYIYTLFLITDLNIYLRMTSFSNFYSFNTIKVTFQRSCFESHFKKIINLCCPSSRV